MNDGVDLLSVIAQFRDAAVYYKITSKKLADLEDQYKLAFKAYVDAHRALVDATVGDILPDESKGTTLL